jgi:hypothetical protein
MVQGSHLYKEINFACALIEELCSLTSPKQYQIMPNNRHYPFDELTDILLVRGEAQRSSSAAVHLHAVMHPQRSLLNPRTFISAGCRLRKKRLSVIKYGKRS